jgi:Lysozyme like domain
MVNMPGENSGPYSAAEHKKAQGRMDSKTSMLMKMLEGTNTSAPSVAPSSTAAPSTKVGSSGKGLISILQQAGFKGEELRKAWAVAMRESGGRASAYNGNAKTGDKSYGLFQINMLGSMGQSRAKKYGLKSYNDLLDPLTNAKVAYQMTRGGWSPWDIDQTGYNYGRNQANYESHYNAYKKYYDQFPNALNSATVKSAAALRISK